VISTLAQTFVGPDVDWFALSPLLVLVGAAVLLLLAGALTPTWPRGLYAVASAAAAIAAGVLAIVLWDDISDGQLSTLVGGALAFDTFAMFVTVVVCAAVVGVVLVAGDQLHRDGRDGPELYALVLVAAAGAVVMGAANDLIVLFLGLETMSLAFYVLAASNRRRNESQESGIKYFILGSFSSAFLLFGIALVYGSTGSTNLGEIVSAFDSTIPVDRNEALLLAGIALLLVGLGFKVAAVPFHVWTPDVYEGAPTPVTALLGSVGKAAAFAAMLRVLVVGLGHYRDDWRPVVWVLAVASLIVGPLLAIVQTDVKRMLAYSSISHAGFMLVGLEAAGRLAGEADSGPGVPSVMVYMITYAVLIVGTFAVVSLVARQGDVHTDLDSYRGLGHRRPALALAFTIFLVAQAGVPFTSGFIAKFGVIGAAVDVSSYPLAIVAMLSTVIAAFLYLRIMVSTWIQDDPPDGGPAMSIPPSTGLAIIAAVAFTLVVGLYPEWLLDLADSTVQFAR
jgi:NADH-quinone oxidoreductase subunit N